MKKIMKHLGIKWRTAAWAFGGFFLGAISGSPVLATLTAIVYGGSRYLTHAIWPNKPMRDLRVAAWTLLGLFVAAIFDIELDVEPVLAIIVATLFAGARVIGELSQPAPKPKSTTPPITDKMAAHYAEAGLTESETELFRKTMDQAASQIQQIEAVSARVPKLHQVASQTELAPLLHDFFKAIVQNPKAMAVAGHFLYEQLPNLLNIMEKYEVISNHRVKTDDTYRVLTLAETSVNDLINGIQTSYQEYVESDLDDLEAAVALVKKQLPESTVMPDHQVNITDFEQQLLHKAEDSHE